jgi:hypothetical protein
LPNYKVIVFKKETNAMSIRANCLQCPKIEVDVFHSASPMEILDRIPFGTIEMLGAKI